MNNKRVLERFLEFIKIDSPTKSEENFANHLIPILESFGMKVEMDDAGKKTGSGCGNIIAKLKGRTGSNPILLSAHMDTVSPGKGINPIVDEGIVRTDGNTILGSDDKAGIAAIIEGIQTVIEEGIPYGDIEVVFTICEEEGLLGSRYLDYSKIHSKTGYVFDTGGKPGKIVTKGPYHAIINAKFIGRESHAGVAPEEGISAIQMLSDAISNMKLLKIDDDTTANIGRIEGGQATNIVSNEASFIAEARSLSEEKLNMQLEHMKTECEKSTKKFGGMLEYSAEIIYEGFDIPENCPVVLNAIKACDNLGFETEIIESRGGSDTNNYNKRGISSVNLSIGQNKAHTVGESIKVDDLYKAAKLVKELILLHA
ncbi:MAG: M20/M25/M40 family metallo-hydrolase [Tissierellia bacterium]|nr:M20/M25/M40 family metallo-hydrolase [Tissierellia bacterium]